MSSPTTPSPGQPGAFGRYLRESETAFAAIVFLFPWVIIYELGTWYFTSDPVNQTETRIVAFSMLRDSLAAVGATAKWVAPATVISVLFGLSIVRREKLRTRLGVQLGMLAESTLLALPLLLIGLLLARYLPLSSDNGTLAPGIILSIGAGIYEELIFRLIGFAALHFFLVDFLRIDHRKALPIVIMVSAVGFSLYHYWGSEHFGWSTFLFRTIAGVYFGAMFASRGFGITAGSHAIYDILIHIMREMPHI